MAQSNGAGARSAASFRAFAEALQSRINGLTTDVVNRDDPFQRAKLADDRQKALAELQRVTGEIDQVKKDIADMEEEARRRMCLRAGSAEPTTLSDHPSLEPIAESAKAQSPPH